MEYIESRRFQAGDSLRDLDARVTARRGEPYTKVYREDRERVLFLCVEDRIGMHFATRGRFKRVIASQCAMLLAWRAFFSGNPFAARIIRDDDVVRFGVHRGRRALARLAGALSVPARREGGKGSRGEPPSPSGLTGLAQDVPSGALVIIVSDFRLLDDVAASELIRVRRRCEVLPVQVFDIFERRLPQVPGRYAVANVQGRVMLSGRDRVAQARLASRVSGRQARLDALVRELRAPLLTLATDASAARELYRFLGGVP